MLHLIVLSALADSSLDHENIRCRIKLQADLTVGKSRLNQVVRSLRRQGLIRVERGY